MRRRWYGKANPLSQALVAGLFLFFAYGPNLLLAQLTTAILPDATLPGGSNSLVLPNGSRMDITGGHTAGSNLFHSFADFHVGAGDTANFFGQGASNILSRVTGANPSNLFGTLGVDTHLPEGSRSTANLFFLNPNGVVIGPNAALDLKGSFYVSTADNMRLGTGAGAGLFSATDPRSDILTSAPPSAFGFLGDTSPVLAVGRTAAISIQGLDTQGSTVVVVGRDAVGGAGGPEIPGVELIGRLASQGGNVTLSSVHATGSAGVDALNLQEFSEGGRISLTEAGVVDVTHPTDPFIGGRIVIRGGQFTMIGKERQDPTEIPSVALLASVANGPAPAIDVEVTDTLLIEDGALATSTAGASDAGNISLTGKTVILTDSTLSSATADLSTGNAGDIRVSGETISVTGSLRIISTETPENLSGTSFVTGHAASLTSTTGQESTGNAGSIIVNGLIVTLSDSTLSSVTGQDSSGNSGDISVTGETVNVNETFNVTGDPLSDNYTTTQGNSSLASETGEDSTGNAGRVTVTGKTVTAHGGLIANITGGAGDGGPVSVTGGTVTILDFSRLESRTFGEGDAGTVSVTGETVTLKDIVLDTSTYGSGGDAGKISVRGETIVTITDSFLNSDVYGSEDNGGNAGSVSVAGKTVTLTNSSLNSQTFATNESGSGELSVTGETVSLTNSTLSSQTIGAGDAGRVSVTGETVTLTHSDLSSAVEPFTLGSTDPNDLPVVKGNAGIVSVTGASVTFKNSSLNSGTVGTGDAGRVSVTGETVNLTDSILTSKAGLDLSDFLPGDLPPDFPPDLPSDFPTGPRPPPDSDSPPIFLESTGNAGNVSVTGNIVTLVKSEVATTQTGAGDGGAITIEAGGEAPLSLIDTTINASVNNRPEGSDPTAGRANITVKGPSVHITGGNIKTETTGTRPGGTITVIADNRLSLKSTQISAQSTGAANAGGVNLSAAQTIALDQIRVTTSSDNASGGNITLIAPIMIHLTDSTMESSVRGDAFTEGGNISVDPDFVVLQNSQILAKAAAGAGGNIDVVGNVVLMDPFSTIDASSQFGISGAVNIQAPIQNLSGTIAPLPEAIVEVGALYSAKCAGQKGGAFSSFTVQSRDRIPLEPGEMLPTPLALASLASSRSPISGRPISPMVQRLSLPSFEGRLFSQTLRDIFIGGCHS